MVKLDAGDNGGLPFDERFFVDWPKGHRPHQVRLEGGDCSSDSLSLPVMPIWFPCTGGERRDVRCRLGWCSRALGAFHGLNPAMGWLFSVALGLQPQ